VARIQVIQSAALVDTWYPNLSELSSVQYLLFSLIFTHLASKTLQTEPYSSFEHHNTTESIFTELSCAISFDMLNLG
jgi:hypothetical protein